MIQIERIVLEHFQAKWAPLCVKKMRENKNLELFPFRVRRNEKGSSHGLGKRRAV